MAKDKKTEQKTERKSTALEVSPKGVAAYSWLHEKDTKFTKDDPDKAKFKVALVLEKGVAEHDAYAESIRAQHAEMEGAPKMCPAKDGNKMKDKDGNPKDDFKGKWVINFSTYNKPIVVDTKKQRVPASVKVFSGDVIRVAAQRKEYDRGALSGVTLQLASVMLIEKNAGGVSPEEAVGAFGDEDGYVADRTDDGFDDDDSANDTAGDY